MDGALVGEIRGADTVTVVGQAGTVELRTGRFDVEALAAALRSGDPTGAEATLREALLAGMAEGSYSHPVVVGSAATVNMNIVEGPDASEVAGAVLRLQSELAQDAMRGALLRYLRAVRRSLG